MAKENVTPDQASALLRKRWESAIARVTPEAIATGKHGERHEIQIEVLKCTKQNMIFMCSRRAGKSEVCCGLLLLTAIRTNDVSCLYLGLTKDAAEPIWRKWKRLLKKFDIPTKTMSDASQFTEFANGSRVLFSGTDDLRTVSHLLGDQLAGGMAVIDEGQSDPGIMETTVEDTLGPMLDETTHDKPIPGRLVLSGTVTDAPIGYYWKTWIQNRNASDTATKEGSLWETFSWNRYENPFQTNNELREAEYCEKYKKNHNDPAVLRRFRGERIWSKEANAYRFSHKEHCYNPAALKRSEIGPFHCLFVGRNLDVTRMIVGIQQSQSNHRFAIVAWGWNHLRKDKVWQLAEAVTDFEFDPLENEWLAVCAEIRSLYPVGIQFIRDAEGSSNETNEALRLSHGIEMNSTIKTSGGAKSRILRLADLLDIGIAKVIEGSALAEDLSVSRWNAKSKKAKKWELDDTHRSPDVAKAATNAFDLPAYSKIGAIKQESKPMTFDEKLEAEQKKTLELLFRGKLPKEQTRPSFVDMWLPPVKI